jgi:SAM-dependent methyltransferase
VGAVWLWRYGKGPLVIDVINCSLNSPISPCVNNAGLKHYVGVDIAKGTLDDFVERIISMSKQGGRSGILSVVHCLVAADLGAVGVSLNTTPLQTYSFTTRKWATTIPLPLNEAARNAQFDVASCQFAMHYMFETRARASRFFDEISRNLRAGGYFIATTMDSRVVADWALQQMTEGNSTHPNKTDDEHEEELCIYSDNVENTLLPESAGGDLVVRMKFEQSQWSRLVKRLDGSRDSSEATEDDGFGVRYTFTLYDTPPSKESGASAVDAPEWLVPLGQPLEDLAAENGMRVVMCMNFHDFITQNMRKYELM